jgi:hypothetical protein
MDTSTAANPHMAYYLTTWKELLAALLGWSGDRVLEWARETGKLEFMADPDDMFFHETPEYWVKYLLVPEDLKRRLPSHEWIEIANRIWAVLDQESTDFPPRKDWRMIRKKVERILAGYGTSLARVDGANGVDTDHRG